MSGKATDAPALEWRLAAGSGARVFCIELSAVSVGGQRQRATVVIVTGS